MWENICKRYNWQGINIQNIHGSQMTPYQKKNLNQKMGRRSLRILIKINILSIYKVNVIKERVLAHRCVKKKWYGYDCSKRWPLHQQESVPNTGGMLCTHLQPWQTINNPSILPIVPGCVFTMILNKRFWTTQPILLDKVKFILEERSLIVFLVLNCDYIYYLYAFRLAQPNEQ